MNNFNIFILTSHLITLIQVNIFKTYTYIYY